jgi:hypothetical protein
MFMRGDGAHICQPSSADTEQPEGGRHRLACPVQMSVNFQGRLKNAGLRQRRQTTAYDRSIQG